MNLRFKYMSSRDADIKCLEHPLNPSSYMHNMFRARADRPEVLYNTDIMGLYSHYHCEFSPFREPLYAFCSAHASLFVH